MSLVPRDYFYYGTRRTASVPAFPVAERSIYRSPSLYRSSSQPYLRNLDYYLPYAYRPYGTWRSYKRYYDWDLYPYYSWERWPATKSYWPYYSYYYNPSHYSYHSWLSSPLRSSWAYDYYYYPRYRSLYRYGYYDWPYWRSYADTYYGSTLYNYRPYSWTYYNTLDKQRGISLWANDSITYDVLDRYWLSSGLYSPLRYSSRYWYLY